MRAQTKLYMQFRAAGYSAADSHRSACIVTNFRDLEEAGLVQLRVEDERDDYFVVYGEPDAYRSATGRYITAEEAREEISRQIDLCGCSYVIAEWREDDCDEWQQADGIGMCICANPLDPVENCYVSDLMLSAIRKLPREVLP